MGGLINESSADSLPTFPLKPGLGQVEERSLESFYLPHGDHMGSRGLRAWVFIYHLPVCVLGRKWIGSGVTWTWIRHSDTGASQYPLSKIFWMRLFIRLKTYRLVCEGHVSCKGEIPVVCFLLLSNGKSFGLLCIDVVLIDYLAVWNLLENFFSDSSTIRNQSFF